MSSKRMQPSYWHTLLTQPHSWLCLHDYINKWAEETPDRTAYIVCMNGHQRESITFKELKEKTQAIGAGLLDLGLKYGDYVLITGITSIDWILCDFACASIGIRPLQCQMRVLTKEGLLTIANKNNCKAIFFHPGEKGEFEEHLHTCIPDAFKKPVNGRITCSDIASLQYVIGMSRHKNDDLMCVKTLMQPNPNLERVLDEQAKVQPEDVLTCYMTSGSTGFPKGIPYSHFSCLNLYRQTRLFSDLVTMKDIIFNDRSLAWLGGLVYLTPVLGNTTVYVHPMTSASANDVDFCIEVIKEEKCTGGILLQYVLVDILERFEGGKTEPFHLEWGMTGGESIQKSIVKRAAKYVDYFTLGYATTEVAFISSGIKTDTLDKTLEHIGQVDKGVEVKIVDDKGEVVPMGETGEVVVRSPFAFKGYLQEEAKGMKMTKQGWIYTNDAGSLTSDGYLNMYGKQELVISRGTSLIYPIVVERMIIQFPGVSKVSVIGVPDKRLGENICACIVPKDGVSLTKEGLLRCFDETYRTDEGLGITPAYFMFMENFPTVNAKINKTTLKKMAIEKFGL